MVCDSKTLTSPGSRTSVLTSRPYLLKKSVLEKDWVGNARKERRGWQHTGEQAWVAVSGTLRRQHCQGQRRSQTRTRMGVVELEEGEHPWRTEVCPWLHVDQVTHKRGSRAVRLYIQVRLGE